MIDFVVNMDVFFKANDDDKANAMVEKLVEVLKDEKNVFSVMVFEEPNWMSRL